MPKPISKEGCKRVEILLPIPLVELIDREAKKTYSTRSDVIRQILQSNIRTRSRKSSNPVLLERLDSIYNQVTLVRRDLRKLKSKK
jgi:metal-responsive CopG/Arc/MetJ family transcriptional regulator